MIATKKETIMNATALETCKDHTGFSLLLKEIKVMIDGDRNQREHFKTPVPGLQDYYQGRIHALKEVLEYVEDTIVRGKRELKSIDNPKGLDAGSARTTQGE